MQDTQAKSNFSFFIDLYKQNHEPPLVCMNPLLFLIVWQKNEVVCVHQVHEVLGMFLQQVCV